MGGRLAVILAAAILPACVSEKRVAVATPAAPTVWERQARNARDAGDGDYLLNSLRQRVAAEPDNIPVRLELAAKYRERGYPDIAVELCRLTLARFPESAEAQFALVRSLYDMQRPREAVAALEARPRTTADYYSWLGLLHDATGSWTVGEPSHRKAVEVAPSQDSLHNNLGYNLLMQGRPQDAASEFREALRLNPASQVARNNLGLALAASDTAQAVSNWQAASDPATAHSNLAAYWIEKRNYSEARKELTIALSYNRSHPAAVRNLALLSQLDGAPASFDPTGEDSRWSRMKTGIKRLFVGPLEESKAAPPKPAPVASTGEHQ
jgi:tetratricopeptide (TPR) repeat protein